MSTEIDRPLNYHDRTMHKLPPSPGLLQNKLIEIDSYCNIQQMKINEAKSKTAIFNTSTTRDFHPRIVNTTGKIYENVDEFTLLGVDIVSHPKLGINWENYILNCIKKAYNKIWILKRLAEIGVSSKDLLMTYESRIRIQVEMNVALYNNAITKKLSTMIEKVQKSCLYIILGKRATPSYTMNLELLNLDRLEVRREQLFENFTKKTIKHPEHRKMFTWRDKSTTRAGLKVVEPKSKTRRYGQSAIPSMARLINKLRNKSSTA